MPTPGKCRCTCSIRPTPLFSLTVSCSPNYSTLSQKCPLICAAMPVIRKPSSYAGGSVPGLSYARPAGVLQQGGHLGDCARSVRPVRTTRAPGANLCGGYVARGTTTRVLVDSAVQPQGQGQLDRVDGRPMRWRPTGQADFLSIA